MKIQCDVCNKQHASLFCTADEAALCDGCDHRVHHANKLASKHQRFSLTHPSAKHFPLCDICQEIRAFVFCQQDRAILCKDCDVSIHSANELTNNHNRFLLIGIKFSATPTPSTPSPPIPITKPLGNSLTTEEPAFAGSSISDYLINTIPGMKFEDFLDSHSVPFALSKNGDDVLSVFGEGNMVSLSGGGMWVPEAEMDEQNNGYKVTMDGIGNNSSTSLGDDNFIVPQMSPPNNLSNTSTLLS